MTEADPKKLGALLKRLRTAAADAPLSPPDVLPDAPDGFDDLLHQLVFSLLLWETTTAQAKSGLRRMREHFSDLNEVRVCMADDSAAALGERYPLARERSLRLRYALHDVFTRQQVLSLAHLRSLPRRDALAYLESLEGLPPFVAHRVAVVCLELHVCPVDDRLRDLLAKDRIIKPEMPTADVAKFLAHNCRAEDSLTTYLLLQQWSDERSESSTKKRARKGKATGVARGAARPAGKNTAGATGATIAPKSSARSKGAKSG